MSITSSIASVPSGDSDVPLELRADEAGADIADRPLELDAKLRQRSVWPSVQAVSRGEELAAPLVVELDPTSFCDLACPGCISEDLLNQARFSLDRLRTLATEFVESRVRAVILIGGGEPLLHRASGDVLRTLGEAGVAIGLTTNGTRIHQYLNEIAAYASWTRVSVDAATEKTYQLVRPQRVGDSPFESIVANMRSLAAMKQGRLGFSFLLVIRPDLPTGSNAAEIASAAELAADIGCDYFELKPQYDSRHFLRPLPTIVRTQVETSLERLSQLDGSGFRIVAPRTIDEVLGSRSSTEPKAYKSCPTTSLRTLVTAAGAYICPYHRGQPAARYGDPTRTPFHDLWNGAGRLEATRRIDPSRDCRFHCIRHPSNLRIIDAATLPSDDVVADFDPFI